MELMKGRQALTNNITKVILVHHSLVVWYSQGLINCIEDICCCIYVHESQIAEP